MASMIDEFTSSDFKATKSNSIQYCKDGSNRHRPGSVTDFEWKDYCPAVFRKLQEFENVDYDDYMLSVCDQATLREVCAPRKVGSLICMGNDDRFVIKTVRKSEVKVLLEMLPKYYQHIRKYGASLLVKLFGLHVVRPVGCLKVYFVVMSNVFRSDLYLHKLYDLKGSLQGRATNKEVVNERTIFKDSDLDFCFYLEPSVQHQLLEQIKLDCEFLEAVGIMDYSLMLGIHLEASDRGSFDMRSPDDKNKHTNNFFEEHGDTVSTPSSCEHPGRPPFKLGVKMQARAIRTPKNEVGNLSANRRVRPQEPHNVLLQFGIADILQSYNMVKRLEHCYKSLQYDSKSISAVNAKTYSSRFLDFVSKIFVAEDSDANSVVSSPLSCN